MDIFLTSLPLQILVTILVIFTAVLAYFRPPFVALLIPIVLPFYLVKIYFRPQSLLNFSSYFLPQYSEAPVIRPDTGTHNLVIPTNLLEILLIIFLLINIPLIIRGFKLVLGKSQGKYFLTPVLLLLLAVVLSTIDAINLRVALGAAKSWFFLPVLLFFALLPLLKNSKFRQYYLYSIAFSGITVSITSTFFLLENIFTYDGRLTGLYLSPNHLAMALVPGIIALIVLLNTRPVILSARPVILSARPVILSARPVILSAAKDLLPPILLLLELIILYFTYSYGAWLALIVSTLVVILSARFVILNAAKDLFSNKKRLSFYLITALILVIIGFSQLNNPKLTHILNGDYYSSLHSRLMIWNSALLISRDHFLSGIGTDNFQQAYLDYQKYFPEPYLEWSAPQPHNIFLAFQTQLGILGLISFMLIVAFTLRSVILSAHSVILSAAKDLTGLWALAYLTYFVLHGLVDTPYMKNDLAILFWLALAVIWAAESTHKAGYASQDK
jgi:O-antigen ligase